MKACRVMALASLFAVAAVLPASADWQSIGSVGFDRDFSRDSVGGPDRPVRALELTARRHDVFCDRVRATFRGGRDADIFSGRLPEDRRMRVDLPGDGRYLDRLDFRCRAERRGARVEVAADLMRYREPGPGWGDDRRGWGSGGGVVRPDNWSRWRLVATESFEGRRDRESSDPGWAGQRVETVALRPVDDDARCRRVVVEFANGNRQELNVGRYDVLRRGLFYPLDLAGGGRTVVRIGAACRAVGDRDVRVEIWLKAKR